MNGPPVIGSDAWRRSRWLFCLERATEAAHTFDERGCKAWLDLAERYARNTDLAGVASNIAAVSGLETASNEQT